MMIDVGASYREAEDTAELATAPWTNALRGSSILAIAAEVKKLRAEGRVVRDLTIGDFDPAIFPIPAAFKEGIKAELDRGETSYPPAVGTLQLREGVIALYRRELGLDVPLDAVIVGSGARPPILAAFQALVEPGDVVVYPVPSWNVSHYCFLSGARGVPVVTRPEDGFMPTAEQLAPYLHEARIVVINSPQNPSGSVIREPLLREVCTAILAENDRRRGVGERPLFLLYDAVYWQLVFGDQPHLTPMHVDARMAPFTVMIDALSKCWSATGLRIGWAVAPPWVRAKMQALIGHMGAWAPRPEQVAAARLLKDPAGLGDFLPHFKRQVSRRLALLQRGIEDMARDGLPISCTSAEAAIYLSVRLDLIGRTTADGTKLGTDEDLRRWLLRTSGVAVVPFTAFGYPEGTGWVRLSVGSVTMDEVEGTLAGLRDALAPFAG